MNNDNVINDNQKEPENQEQLSDADKLKKERDEYLDGWQRARAELINYRKDESKRFETFKNFSNEMIIMDLIVVLDSFDLAIAALEKEGKADKGIYLIKSQMEDALKNNGLEKIIISVGQQFDPVLHEAVASVESDNPSNAIVEEIERGYLLNGKLLRPARVKVAK